MTAADALRRVEELWRTTLTTPLHGPFCSCHAGGGPVTFSADVLEDDLLDYLIPHYRSRGENALADLLETRRGARKTSFLEFLSSTAVVALGREANTALLADLSRTLESLVTGARSHPA